MWKRVLESLSHRSRGARHQEDDVPAIEPCMNLIVKRLGGRVDGVQTEKADLTRQLYQSQKLEVIGLMVGGVAHDFNNLLSGIIGHADLAKMELPEGASACECVDEIRQAARLAIELVQQLTTYAAGGGTAASAVVLSDAVVKIQKLLKVVASKKIVLVYDLAEKLPPLCANQSQIMQVVMNLVMNASDAITVGGRKGTVTISTGLKDLAKDDLRDCVPAENAVPGRYVYVNVADTGCGMDAATAKEMFTPFFTTKPDGRGLGLAVVLGIVKAQNGFLRVQSEVGKGSTFRVFFPCPPDS